MQKAISYHWLGEVFRAGWKWYARQFGPGVMSEKGAFVVGVLAVLSGPAWSLMAQPKLLVPSQLDRTVKEYDGTTGAFIRNAATGAGQPLGLSDPLDAIFGPDGNLLVTDGRQNEIKRFDPADALRAVLTLRQEAIATLAGLLLIKTPYGRFFPSD